MDEFKERFSAARAHRREFIQEAGREVYKFCFNGREGEWDERPRKDKEGEEIFTDFPATVAEEFYGELFSTMTPENAPWAEYEAGNGVDANKAKDASREISDFEKIMAKSIRSSNYYDEGQIAFQDAVVGTVSMWVERPSLSSPILIRALPISKAFLRLGPRGLEDRFFRESYFYRDLPSIFPKAKFPREIEEKIKKGSGSASVVWGFWRDYSDSSNPIWKQCIRVDEKPIDLDEDLGGEGSCPMLVGRFNPVAGSAWGRGPGVRMLPTLRVLNEVTRMNLQGMDRTLDPAYVYQHDGILDLSDGVESGIGYPAMPGTTNPVTPLGLAGSLDYGFFSEERLQDIVRDGFYREVTQRGKTPPTASQYVGQEQKQVRRMARPAGKLWREIGVGLLTRIEFLERESGGALESADLSMIESGAVIARPISPLERAQAREDVLVSQSIIQMVNEGLGPEQAALLIDGPKSFRNIKDKLKDRLVEFRDEKAIIALAQAMQPQVPDAQA